MHRKVTMSLKKILGNEENAGRFNTNENKQKNIHKIGMNDRTKQHGGI